MKLGMLVSENFLYGVGIGSQREKPVVVLIERYGQKVAATIMASLVQGIENANQANKARPIGD